MHFSTFARAARARFPLAGALSTLLTGLAISLISAFPALAQTPPAPLHAGCQAAVGWVVGDEGPETVDLLFVGLAGDTIAIFATNTPNDGFQDISVPCLPAGIYEGRLTVTSAGEVVSAGPLRLLVSEAPDVRVAIAGDVPGEACSGTLMFSGRVLDDCGVAAGDVSVDVELLTANATLGTPDVSITTSGDTIFVSGSVAVTDISDSAAVVRVTITAADGCALVASASAEAVVGDDTPPVVTCPQDVTIDCTALGGTPADDPQLEAFFDGFTATDECDTALTLTNDAPDFFPLGETLVTFTATDGSGNSASCTATVAVIDTVPPTIEVDLNRHVLWPPNHKFHDIVASVIVTDDCDPEPGFVLVSIESNESPNGRGDGNTQPDVRGDDPGTADLEFALRAERSGNGAGRVYTITYRAFDTSGNEALATAHVRVPHDRGGRARASNGYAAGGRAFQTADGRIAIVVPSWTDDLDGTVFDAMTIRYPRTQIGNDKGVVDVAEIYLGDVDLDSRRDAVFVFPREATERLHLKARGQQDKTSMHFEDLAGIDWVVYDIFELGEPLTVDLGALERWVAPEDADGSDDSSDEAAEAGAGDRVLTGLLMAQPNPFTPSTTIRFMVPKEGPVSLRIYDVAGRPVRVLAEGFHAAGEYRVRWDGTRRGGDRMTPGVYLVRFEMDGVVTSDKVVMLR
jgi:hypothetical protein